MVVPLTFLAPNASATSIAASVGLCSKLCGDFPSRRRRPGLDGARVSLPCVRASAEQRSESLEESENCGRFSSPGMEVTTFGGSFSEAEFPIWEKIGAVVGLSYGIGKNDLVHASLDVILKGLGYAAPPIMARA